MVKFCSYYNMIADSFAKLCLFIKQKPLETIIIKLIGKRRSLNLVYLAVPENSPGLVSGWPLVKSVQTGGEEASGMLTPPPSLNYLHSSHFLRAMSI